ncbi:MAG: hypothetical protein K2O40_08620, partial [Lachnospiraceae bacterium]|nr:hypothetical protein [Lachnospiraceae bacterium]
RRVDKEAAIYTDEADTDQESTNKRRTDKKEESDTSSEEETASERDENEVVTEEEATSRDVQTEEEETATEEIRPGADDWANNQTNSENLLSNPSFEDGLITPWIVTKKDSADSGAKISNAAADNKHSGNWSLHFYDEGIVGFNVEQRIDDLAAGTYTFGGYIMGDDKASGTIEQLAYVEVFGSDGQSKGRKDTQCYLNGWTDKPDEWSAPKITGIKISEGDYLVVGMEVETAAGAWGDIDDFYLYAEDTTEQSPADGTKKYENVTINLNYYVGDLDANAAEEVGFYKWGNGYTIDTTKNPQLTWGGWGDAAKNPVYKMEKVDGHSGWFHISFVANETIVTNSSDSEKNKSDNGFSIFRSKEAGKDDAPLLGCSGYVDAYPEIYIGLLEGDVVAIKNTDGVPVGYASIEAAEEATKEPDKPDEPDQPREWTFEELTTLIADADKCNEADYTKASWNTFAKALADAKKITETSTREEVMAAYEALGIAKNVLVSGSVSYTQLRAHEPLRNRV